jgi:hypothetical protein
VGAQNAQNWTASIVIGTELKSAQIESARGYQAIFVSLAALSSPSYSPIDGQPAVYVYIAAIEVNVLNCRDSRAIIQYGPRRMGFGLRRLRHRRMLRVVCDE